MSFNTSELELISHLNFDLSLLSFVKELVESEFKKFTLKNFLENQTEGISFLASEKDSYDLLKKIRNIFEGKGYIAFISEKKYSFEKDKLEKEFNLFFDKSETINVITIIKTDDPYNILKIMSTSAPNFDLDNQEIIDKIKSWENISEFFISGASYDWVSIIFEKLPDNIEKFADEVYEFCPDTLDQGFHAELPKDFSEEDFEDLFESQTTKDLANSIKKYKYLFLWWD